MCLALSSSAQAPEVGLELKIVREQSVPQALELSDCLPGIMYVSDPATPMTGAGDVRIGSTLELPWKYNQRDISAIPVGSYVGHVRDDGDKGWRIELDKVNGRDNIQVHLGNWPKDTEGCIFAGYSRL